MNSRLTTVLAALSCAICASCYPYDESQDRKPGPTPAQKTVSSADQQKVKEQRDRMKEKNELKKSEELPQDTASTTTTTTTSSDTPKLPVAEKRSEYSVAGKVPGKDGFVFSPYNNKVVDVRDIPTGTLVQDPTYTGAGKGYFRVP